MNSPSEPRRVAPLLTWLWKATQPLALFTALTATPLLGAEIDHAKIALSTEEDLFSLDDPRPLYSSRLYPASLSEAGTVFFYPQGGLFSLGPNYLYQGTRKSVLSRFGRDSIAPRGETFGQFRQVDTNPAGKAAIAASTGRGIELYFLNGTQVTPVALIDDDAAGDGRFHVNSGEPFDGDPAIGATNHIAFHARTDGSGQGIFLATPAGSSSRLKRIARINDDSLDTGKFSGFDTSVAVGKIGRDPLVAFTATTTGSIGQGLYLSGPTGLKLVAGGLRPSFAMNNTGQIVYANSNHIYLGSYAGTGQAAAVISAGDPAPGGTTFSAVSGPMINDRGQISFSASTNGFSSSGLYLWTPDTGIKTIALIGQAFDGGVFDQLNPPEITDSGLVMFTGIIRRGSNAYRGLYLGNGDGLLKVMAVGDPLLDSLVKEQDFFFYSEGPTVSNPGRLPGHGSVNSHGQVSYRAYLANTTSGIFLFTPSLHWAASGDGTWDTAANWTLGLLPSAEQNVTIDPAIDLTVTGPSVNTKVLSLTVGGGAGLGTLHLQPKKVVATKNGATVLTAGILEGSGTIGGKLTLQPGATVRLNLGGRERGTTYDFVKVTGPLTLNGTLNVALTNGFVPVPGDVFDLLDFPSRRGVFTTVNLPATPSPAFVWSNTIARNGKLALTLQSDLQGAYVGVLQGTTPAFSSSGPITLTVKANGQVIAAGTFGGRRITFKGALDVMGQAHGPLFKGGPEFALQLDLNRAPGQITGTLSDNGTPIASVTADLAPAYKSTILAGDYTIGLPPDAAAPNPAKYPQGVGFAALKVTPKGSARFVGLLGDGTPISGGGRLTAKSELPMHLALYRKTGSLFGTITLHGRAPGDVVDGTLKWSRPATTAPTFYDELAATISVEGSPYTSPSFAPGSFTFTTRDGGIASFSKAFTIDAKNKVVPDPAGELKIKLAAHGLFSGSFLSPNMSGGTTTCKFRGAVLQQQHAGKGLFPGIEQTGAIKIE